MVHFLEICLFFGNNRGLQIADMGQSGQYMGQSYVFCSAYGTLFIRNFHEGDRTHEVAHGPDTVSALLPRAELHC